MKPNYGFDIYHQTIANVRFFSPEHALVRIITACEPKGTTFRVAVVREVDMGRHREVVLSETGASIQLALQALHMRSAEAVHNHIAMYGFDFAPELKRLDVWESEDEGASGFSVDESTVAYSGVISNDRFSDDDVAVEFEDDDYRDKAPRVERKDEVAELAVTGDESHVSNTMLPFPKPTIKIASSVTPAANSSKPKARKVRAPKPRSRYGRSRSRSKSSTSRQPRGRSEATELPLRPVSESIETSKVDAPPQDPRQYQKLPPVRVMVPSALPTLPTGTSKGTTDADANEPIVTGNQGPIVRCCTSQPPIYPSDQGSQEFMDLKIPPPVPPMSMAHHPGFPAPRPQAQHLFHPRIPGVPAGAIYSIPPYVRNNPNNIPRGAIPSQPSAISTPIERPPQPPTQPILHDIRLHITRPGRGTARILERCEATRHAIIDAALAYVRAHPGAFADVPTQTHFETRWGPRPPVPCEPGVNNASKLMKGSLKRAWFRQMRNGRAHEESYDMGAYLGEDLSRLFDAAGGAAWLVFEVEVSGGAGGNGIAGPGWFPPGHNVASPWPRVPLEERRLRPGPQGIGGPGEVDERTYRGFVSEDEEIVDD